MVARSEKLYEKGAADGSTIFKDQYARQRGLPDRTAAKTHIRFIQAFQSCSINPNIMT